ncbi:hypothetical protein ATE67_11385 [Sphingopyxis sp. H050]|nr:hypothetical protein ATE67_11385 [Sphingopyxis sp. H050]
MGRAHQFSIAMDRALNGVTIVRVLKGGAVDVSGGPDMAPSYATRAPLKRQRRQNDRAHAYLLSL